jgi:hypothetical protein
MEHPMPRPTMQNVRDILEPYHPRIRGVVELAWAEWRTVAVLRADEGLPPLMYSRTVANYVFDAIARIAVDEFASDNSVHLKIEAQTVKFHFKAGVLVRFKKGDDNKLGRNIPTQSALAFADPDCLFSDLPPDTAKVEVIWIANEIQTLLDHVLVVARDGDRLLWDYEIEESGAGEGTVIPFPMFPNDPGDDRDDEELIRAKKAPEKNTKEEK